MKMNKKGFTLIEMLVVIAIIAILVAIIVPTVTSATTKAKAATDAANLRSAKAVAVIGVLDGTYSASNVPDADDLKIPGTSKLTGKAFKITITGQEVAVAYTDAATIPAAPGAGTIEYFAGIADGTISYS